TDDSTAGGGAFDASRSRRLAAPDGTDAHAHPCPSRRREPIRVMAGPEPTHASARRVTPTGLEGSHRAGRRGAPARTHLLSAPRLSALQRAVVARTADRRRGLD